MGDLTCILNSVQAQYHLKIILHINERLYNNTNIFINYLGLLTVILIGFYTFCKHDSPKISTCLKMFGLMLLFYKKKTPKDVQISCEIHLRLITFHKLLFFAGKRNRLEYNNL